MINRMLTLNKGIVLGLIMLPLSASTLADDLHAVFPGNQAVTVSATGKRHVEYSPQITTNADVRKGLHGEKMGVGYGYTTIERALAVRSSVFYMIESIHGLLECTEMTIDPRACRPSTFGKVKLLRDWSVKLNGAWQHCKLPPIFKKPDHGKYMCSANRSAADYALSGNEE